ncbi:hypothetical protein NQ318_015285 [Aromia moschata]|uniref:Uncharacterized protein n=1 Tax=Aromia moschata TaxID=1265417 RepID=A0AAV8XE40_9CUCU|nr:hypothetical protein NQ318_015285 [Aromia moschata]
MQPEDNILKEPAAYVSPFVLSLSQAKDKKKSRYFVRTEEAKLSAAEENESIQTKIKGGTSSSSSSSDENSSSSDCESDPFGSDDSVKDPPYNPPIVTEMRAETPTGVTGKQRKVKYPSGNEKVGRKKLKLPATWQKANANKLQNSGEAYLSMSTVKNADGTQLQKKRMPQAKEQAYEDVNKGTLSIRAAAKRYELYHVSIKIQKKKEDALQQGADTSVMMGYKAWNKVFFR